MRAKLLIIGLFTLLMVGLVAATAAAAPFNPLGDPCSTAPASSSPACQQNAKQNGSTTNPTVDIIKTAANLIAAVGGISAVIVIIISGFMFVTAGGGVGGQRSSDPSRAKNARAALTGALIGLVIIALAWTIVTFVADKFVKT
jgi:hypothetical protein